MVVVANVKAPEQFLHNINGDYSLLFDVIEVEANTVLQVGTVLEYTTAAGGGWKVKDPASNSTKLGILAEYVKASPEAQKVKVAIRSNAFNAAI